jgi:hypothetical protein
MILALSRLYGIDLTRQGAIAPFTKNCPQYGGISASEFLAVLGLSS